MFIHIIGFVLLSIAFIAGIRPVLKAKGPNLYTAFLFGYYYYFGIVPFFIQTNISLETSIRKDFVQFLMNYSMPDIVYYMIVLLYMTFVIVAYNSYSFTSYKFRPVHFNKWLKIFAISSFVIGVLSSLAYYHAMGGFLRALTFAEFNRSLGNSMQEEIGSSFILFYPAKLIIIAPYLYCLYLMNDKSRRNIIVFIFAVIFAIMFYLFEASRSSLVIIIISLLFPIIIKFTRHPWSLIVIIALLGSNILNILDSLFIYFASGEWLVEDFDLYNVAMQYSFPYRNVLYCFNIVSQGGVRWGVDFFTCFLEFIPGLSFDPSVAPTCIFFNGPDWHSYGGIPNDVITISVLEFHILGLIIFPLAIGYLLKRADSFIELLYGMANNKNFVLMVQSYLMFMMFFFVGSADPNAIVQGYAIFVFFFLFCTSITKGKGIHVNNT